MSAYLLYKKHIITRKLEDWSERVDDADLAGIDRYMQNCGKQLMFTQEHPAEMMKLNMTHPMAGITVSVRLRDLSSKRVFLSFLKHILRTKVQRMCFSLHFGNGIIDKIRILCYPVCGCVVQKGPRAGSADFLRQIKIEY